MCREAITHDYLSPIAALARAERTALCALARSEGMSPADAVDCVQEGLCALLEAARAGALATAHGEWAPLLAGIVRNIARNRRRRHFLRKPHDDVDAHPLTGGEEPDVALARAEDTVRLRACVQELCGAQKAVVTLRMLDEQPGEDVARALGISAGHVAVLLHRAKLALRSCMAPGPQQTVA